MTAATAAVALDLSAGLTFSSVIRTLGTSLVEVNSRTSIGVREKPRLAPNPGDDWNENGLAQLFKEDIYRPAALVLGNSRTRSCPSAASLCSVSRACGTVAAPRSLSLSSSDSASALRIVASVPVGEICGEETRRGETRREASELQTSSISADVGSTAVAGSTAAGWTTVACSTAGIGSNWSSSCSRRSAARRSASDAGKLGPGMTAQFQGDGCGWRESERARLTSSRSESADERAPIASLVLAGMAFSIAGLSALGACGSFTE